MVKNTNNNKEREAQHSITTTIYTLSLSRCGTGNLFFSSSSPTFPITSSSSLFSFSFPPAVIRLFFLLTYLLMLIAFSMLFSVDVVRPFRSFSPIANRQVSGRRITTIKTAGLLYLTMD